jgi:hypothetical protein
MRSLRARWGGAGGRRRVVSSMVLLERLRLECLSLRGGSGLLPTNIYAHTFSTR